MPTVSEAQRRAMWAAAKGESTLGISRSVGKEFVAADSAAPIAAGTVFVAPDGDVLLLLRSDKEKNFAGHWGLPGGKADPGESAEDAADRENREELGNTAPVGDKILVDQRETPNGMVFHSFLQAVDDKFWPKLNDEHSGAGWFPLGDLPGPMHPAVASLLASLASEFDQAQDEQPMLTTAPSSGGPAAGGKRKPLAFSVDSVPPMGEDGVHAACDGRGCKTCGWTGVANTNYWPMKPSVGAMDSLRAIAAAWSGAADEWNEGEHPRSDDGKFGAGGASTSKKANSTSKKSSSSSSSLKMGELSKKGGKLGSNEGGLYEHANGSKFYIKKPGTKAHVENERMAAQLYNLAGSKTLDYRDVEGGEHVATEWKQLEKKNIAEFTPAERKEAAKDFAVHAWLSNWDAAGTGGDNQGILGGKTTTLDVGGSLRFRAQGGPKGSAFGDKVNEWDTMRNKGMSPDAARLFTPMTESELKASVEKVTSIPDGKIRAAVGKDTELADRLIARKKDLASRVGLAMDALSPAIAAWNKAADAAAARAASGHACQLCGGTGELAGPGSACDECGGSGLALDDGMFKEEDHPRDDGGKFSAGGSGGNSGSEVVTLEKPKTSVPNVAVKKSSVPSVPVKPLKSDAKVAIPKIEGVKSPTPPPGRQFVSVLRSQELYQASMQEQPTTEEIKALGSYTSNGYRKMNSRLRGVLGSLSISSDVKMLDSLISKAELPEDVSVYRGIGPELAQKISKSIATGKEVVFSDKAFVSSSRDRAVAAQFSDHVLEFVIPKGSNALSVPAGTEEEMLLGRNRKFRVLEVSGKTIKAELV